MPPVSKPYTFVNGTTIDADEVNADFDILYGALTADLDADNLADGAVTNAKVVNESWTNATLLGTWVNPGVGNATPGYKKDVTGRVSLRGLVRNGTSPTTAAAIFTLPAGYRPAGGQLRFPARYWNGTAFGSCEVKIDTAGNVTAENHDVTGWLTLDQVSFLP